jgi:hypothetical protein
MKDHAAELFEKTLLGVRIESCVGAGSPYGAPVTGLTLPQVLMLLT